MNEIVLSTRCLREEYMDFAVKRQKSSLAAPIVGVAAVTLGAVIAAADGTIGQGALLLLFVGVLLLLFRPLIRPLVVKGQAARRYDASDFLRSALSLRVTEDTLHLKAAGVEAALPLCALTAVVQTPTVLGLCFAEELTVCVPMRAFSEEERRWLTALLSKYKDEKTI